MASTIRNLTVHFGLVEFQASLKKAAEKKDVTFESAVRVQNGTDKAGEPVYTYERVQQTRSGARSGAVASTGVNGGGHAQIVKGVWVGEDEFRPVPDGALEAVTDAAQIEGIELEEFVSLKDVPWHRVEAAYYLTPMKGLIGAKPMRLLRDALQAEKVAGVCKLCLKGTGGRQKLAVVHVQDGMLIVNLLAFADDFREADESAKAVEGVEVDRQHLSLARKLVRERVVPASKLLTEAVDEAVAERERLYAELLDGRDAFKPKGAPVRESGPTDLMAALQASIDQAKAKVPA